MSPSRYNMSTRMGVARDLQAIGGRMPAIIKGWKLMYENGMSCQDIALETGWKPNQRVWKPGRYSPSTIRKELRRWDVDMRKSGGGRGSRYSLLTRVASLEDRVKTLEIALEAISSEV